VSSSYSSCESETGRCVELQFEEHDRINGGATNSCIALMHKLPHKREVKGSFEMAIEVICWHSLF